MLANELRVTLDYETKSRADLERCGAIEYAKHPSTRIICLGWKIGAGPNHIWLPHSEPMPSALWSAIKRGAILVAHNASFERAITRHTLTRCSLTVEQHECLGSLPISRWRCTAAKAAASALPRNLEMGCKILDLPTQKDMEGNKLIKKYSKPRKISKNNKNLWWDDKADLRRIYDYCRTDVQAEWELDEALPDLSDYEQRVWELDQKINDYGVLIDIPTVRLVLGLIQEEMADILPQLKKLSGGVIDKPTQTARILKWVNERGGKMTNLQSRTIEDKLLDENLSQKIRHMLTMRKMGSKTSIGKYTSMLHAMGSDHRARELLLYNGAIPTARWAGKRIQPHNFPRPITTIKNFNSDEAIALLQFGGREALQRKYGKHNVMDVLVSVVRGMLIASPGCDLYCSDFMQVEARLAFWVAEYQAGIDMFKGGGKPYEEMAAQIFDLDVNEIAKDSLERFVGKETLLGAQYGMGWLKFIKQCHQKSGKRLTPEMAKKAIYTYRRVHHPIPQLWRNLEEAAIAAISEAGSHHLTNKVTFYVKGRWLNIKLPSGRRLRYFKPRLKQKQLASGRMVPEIRYQGMEHHQWGEVAIWGGIFCNHIVQGIARDLMANGMLNLDLAGYKLLLSVHDEALSERKKGFGSVKDYTRHFTRLPEWAQGAPIEASSWSGPRYHK